MKIKVWTNHPNHFIHKVCKELAKRGYAAECNALFNSQFDGEAVSFAQLSLRQFNAVEDVAAWTGLQYDGSQE